MYGILADKVVILFISKKWMSLAGPAMEMLAITGI